MGSEGRGRDEPPGEPAACGPAARGVSFIKSHKN